MRSRIRARSSAASVAVLLAAAVVCLPACRNGAQNRQGQAGRPLTPDKDPRLQPHLDQFAQVEALISRWDSLRANGRKPEAELLAPSITQAVDADYPTFDRAARGQLGLYAQYLAVSALGFATNPAATTCLGEQVAGRDGKLAGNAFIALSVRADPNTSADLIIARINSTQPLEVKRYAPLALASVLDAQARAGRPSNQGQERMAMTRLGTIVVDQDPIVRLHVAKALSSMRVADATAYLRVLTSDPVMRVRWAGASALARQGRPAGFTAVVQLLSEVAPDSKHIIRDILISYAGTLQGRALSDAEISSLGIGPRAWSQWFNDYQRKRNA